MVDAVCIFSLRAKIIVATSFWTGGGNCHRTVAHKWVQNTLSILYKTKKPSPLGLGFGLASLVEMNL